MNLNNLKNINFWAREFRLPLFWMVNKKQPITSDDTLIFYKDKIMHCYHLNNKGGKAAKTGYKFFSKKENLNKYESDVKKIHKIINDSKEKFKKINLNKLSDKELKKLFLDFVDKLIKYVNVYSKTEEMFLVDLERESKYGNTIKKLGNLRFSLRKEGEPLFYILLGILLKELSKRSKVKVADLFFYDQNELLKIFDGIKVKESVIKERSKGFAILVIKKKFQIYTGIEFKQAYKDIVLNKKEKSEIKGQIAMKGIAKGKVRILRHNKKNIYKEVSKFKKGEILVTEMTRPDVVMACRKAAAIITDEGGIASHAAIIARELKIPAVIGTKHATQILKDGDLVEVDANKGIVKIIK